MFNEWVNESKSSSFLSVFLLNAPQNDLKDIIWGMSVEKGGEKTCRTGTRWLPDVSGM